MPQHIFHPLKHISVRLLGAAMMLLCAIQSHANEPLDSLYRVLATIDNSADSVSVLFDIYDCSDYQTRGEALNQLFYTARRANNEYAALESLYLLAGFHENNEDAQPELLARVRSLPDSDARQRTELYIKVRHAAQAIRDLPETELFKQLHDNLVRYKETRKLHTYDRIEYLFYICSYIRSATDGDLLIKYLHELETLIEQLPPEELYLRSLFYKQASMSYLANEKYREAVAANRKVLEINHLFDKRHGADGRPFRYYTGSTYLAYHNILMCYDVLTPEEIDTCYSRMLELERSTVRLQDSPALRDNSRIYYMMATKRYAEAIPLIKQQLKTNTSREEYKLLVDALLEAAEKLNDEENLLFALRHSNRLLEERLNNRSDQSLKELQILYEIYNLRSENDNLERESLIMNNDYHREQLYKISIALFVTLVILIAALLLYRRSRHLADRLKKSHTTLTAERDVLKNAHKDLVMARDRAKAADKFKNDFVNNLNREISTPLSAIVEYSHLLSDYALSDKREYIKKFGMLLSRNCDLLVTLVNDVLELPSLENAHLSVTMQTVSVQNMCHWAMDLIRHHVPDNVELVYESDAAPDIMVSTDPNRIEQILVHMLSNAVKFTEHGVISLAYTISDEEDKVSFIVSDTGIGIPRGKEEAIFSRFEKLSSSTQGNGLGLYICRLLAKMLKGTINLDASYRKGARFILTIPVG